MGASERKIDGFPLTRVVSAWQTQWQSSLLSFNQTATTWGQHISKDLPSQGIIAGAEFFKESGQMRF